MEDQELRQKLETLEKKIDATYESAEKTRWYFKLVGIISVIAVVLPLIGFLFAIPSFLSVYSSMGSF